MVQGGARGGLKGDGAGHDGEKGDIMKKPQSSWCTTGASVCLGYGACVVKPRLAVCFGCRAGRVGLTDRMTCAARNGGQAGRPSVSGGRAAPTPPHLRGS